MNVYLEPFAQMPQMMELREALQRESNIYEVAGVIDAVKPHLIYALTEEANTKLVVTFDELHARALMEGLSFFEENVLYYPARDLLFYQSDIHGNALTRQRQLVVQALLEKEKVTVVTTIDALMNRIPPMESYQRAIFSIESEGTVDLTKMCKSLTMLGYETVTQVEHPGEFAVRGGIVDIFPLTAEAPVRMELWGDEVDSLRTFDPATQKSTEQISRICIYPATELVLTKEEMEDGLSRLKKDADDLYEKFRAQFQTEEAHRVRSHSEQLITEAKEWGMNASLETHMNYFVEGGVSLLSYFPEDTILLLDETLHLAERGRAVAAEFTESMTSRLAGGYCLPRDLAMLMPVERAFAEMRGRKGISLATLDGREEVLPLAGHYSIRVVSSGTYNNRIELLLHDLRQYCKRKYRVLLLSPSRTRAQNLADHLLEQDIVSFYTEDSMHAIHPGEVMVSVGNLARGYEFPDTAFVVLSEQDIFGTHAKKRKKKKRFEGGDQIASFRDLVVGDYVVHENHGLGIYQGFEKIEVDKVVKDYIKIAYAKGGNLYIPVTQLDAIQKYGSREGKKPKLNTLGTQDWVQTKERVRAAVGVVAKELVELYALREQDNGYVFGPDTVWQQEFEEAFPYEETAGQLEAIEAVKADMMSPKIMDRLICGDVGYGKTEIALRAAFKAVQEGKQVVYLVPTTILAQQHYHTFLQRMAHYPINIGLMCRFVSAAEQKKTLVGLKNGQVDIAIGTHRLLSADVAYKDLGLLIIDEEQRFGVNHKERIKQMKKNVDVISLSATPIPRTLHMSLVGIRDMSLLEEAPMERQPIQTFVFEYNEEMIREAIVREMARGGQVYYVYNRVRQIADIAARVESLVPEANVAYAHGKMTESRLEKIMYDFINHDTDVLVATTIIEIGLDISNVNTIIIHDADQLGLSQLYQLRGRVGRSNRSAYAFLMYKQDRMLKEVAEKRLAAIKEFTDLGSGFKIAMRDLEIRGAGNLLGREQHGHMEAVGYDMYCKMLGEAVRREKGEIVEVSFDTAVDLDLDAYLPETYVPSEEQRLDLYKRISLIANEEEHDEMLDELLDRFGDLPRPVENLLFVAMLRIEAHAAYVTEISQKEEDVVFTLFAQASLDVAGIPDLIDQYAPYVTFTADLNRPAFHFYYKRNSRLKAKDLPEAITTFVKELQKLALPQKKDI